jgi:diguanylate cyclase (GGDEF)-like protein
MESDKSNPLERLRAQLASKPDLIFRGAVAIAVVILAFAGLLLESQREDALHDAVANAENLGLVVERDITRNFQLYDLSLQAVLENVLDPEVQRIPVHYRQLVLFDRSASAGKFLGALLYIDEHGNVRADSVNETPRPGNFADRPWFAVHRDHPRLGLYIGKPTISRLLPNREVINVSRRVNHPDGSFAGVVVGAIDLDYFRQLLSGLKLGQRGALALTMQDGTVVMRLPYRTDWIGRSLRGTPNFDRYLRSHERSFIGTGVIDGEHRLFVYRQFAEVPMLLSVVPSLTDVYADWWRMVSYVLGLTAVLIAVLLSTAWMLTQEFRHRLHVEKDLLLLSRLDGLTGLVNRRTLDESLQQEWLRSRRTGKPMALLFIDIDRFKSYNDLYGHQAGDEVLMAVARTISRCLKRPADIAARFGGEEFVLILPETGIPGAEHVAEQVHKTVRALRITHGASEHGIVTVSIGYACNNGGHVESAEALVQAADAALYRAKERGRNQTCAAREVVDQHGVCSSVGSDLPDGCTGA